MALEARVGNTLDGCTYRFLSLVAAPVYGGDRDFEVYDLVIQWVNDGGADEQIRRWGVARCDLVQIQMVYYDNCMVNTLHRLLTCCVGKCGHVS